MQKKVFIIILPIAFFIFYGCSSMKHSTIVLYVSHKVEGPLYMPQQEPPVSAQAPQTNTVNQSSQERRPARGSQATQNNSQTNQNSQSTPAPTSRRPSRGSQTQAIQVVTNTYRNGYQTRTLPRGEFLILENPIRFAFEKYGIDSSYDGSVQYVANYMKENTNFQLVVEGHTDRVGEYDYNSSLSLRRSRSAISKLVRAGVERNRLIPSGVSYRFSEYNFNRLNRRVEFIIIRNPEELTNYREAIK